MTCHLYISSKGLKHLPMELHDGDFEFVIGGTSYKCNIIIAEFLSPKICSLRRADPSVSQYALQVHDSSCTFKDFLSLALEPHLEVDSQDMDFFMAVAHELENQELLSQLVSHYTETTKITVSNALEFLRIKQMSEEGDEAEIDFIARNFHDIKDLATLEIDYLRRVLSHPSLRIQSEDALYSFICGLIDTHKDPSYSELFEFVIFKFLSASSIQHFINTSSAYIFDHLNLPLWKALCDRLSQKLLIGPGSSARQEVRYGCVVVEDELKKREDELREKIEDLTKAMNNEKRQRHSCEMEISSLRAENETQKQRITALSIRSSTYNGSNPFDGILASFRQICGGNPDTCGLVKVNASSRTGQVHQILNYDWNCWFSTEKDPNSWIELDMKEYQVSVTHYTLKSHAGRMQWPQSWVLECSNDHVEWEIVDKRNTKDLVGPSRVKTYPVQRSGTFYRYVRVRQTGKNSSNDDQLLLTNIELFGKTIHTV